jgi:hypothetical protein
MAYMVQNLEITDEKNTFLTPNYLYFIRPECQ